MNIKRIRLKGLKNTRDLGGFQTSDGKTIKYGMLIRSGHLNKAKPSDINVLYNEHNLKTVIDLRIDAEIAEKPDKLKDGINYIHLPLLDKTFLGITRDEYSLRSWFNIFADRSKRPEDIFYEMYEMLVFGSRTQNMISEIFRILLDKNSSAVLWHCSAGKDRVGIVTMLILLALGVDRELIVQDFLATNKFSAAEILKTRVFAPLVIRDRYQRKCLAVLMGVKREYLDRLFIYIDSNFDSVEDMFERHFGISSDMLDTLKEYYTE